VWLHREGEGETDEDGVTPGFKGQNRVHLIYAPKKTTYIITELSGTIIRVPPRLLISAGNPHQHKAAKA
jgi:hypothetical protein